MQPERYDRIEGLTAREPVDAVLTVGEKIMPKGYPGNTDRFFVHAAYEEKQGTIGVRPNHPAFAKFNGAAPEHRKSIIGNIVHAERAECFVHSLTNQKAPDNSKWVNSPNQKPFCTGDGIRATRLYAIGDNGDEDFRSIPCPNDACEFRQGDAKMCKPFARLYFRPQWPAGSSLPTPLMKFETRSWNTVANMLGFFEFIENAARGLALDSYTLFGFRFVLTLHRKTKATRQRAFPVVTMSPDVDPLTFFMQQRRDVALAGGRPLLQLVGATSPEENEPEAIAASLRELSGEPPKVPGEVIEGELVGSEEDSIENGPTPIRVPDHVKRILDAGTSKGMTIAQLTSLAGADVMQTPAGAETEILRAIKSWRATK